MIPGVMVPCLTCGEPTDEGPRCADHVEQRPPRQRESFRARAYDAAWDRLSRRARQRQNFCGRCGSTSNLSADHLPIAWWRRANGLPIRLRDVEVLCAACQSAVGSSRPGTPRYEEWEASRAED